MLFRLIFFFILIVLVVRLVMRLFSGAFKSFKGTLFPRPGSDPSSSNPVNVIDEMRPCATCGTYAPSRHAYQKNGLYFCNRECHEIYLTRQKA